MIDRHLDAEPPRLAPDAELVVYRIAQEAATNAIRPSGASCVDLALCPTGGAGLQLRVRDDDVGRHGSSGPGRGVRERRHGRCGSRSAPRARGRRGDPPRRPRDGTALVSVPLKTRILVVDDPAIVRRGLRLILDGEPDLEVIGEAGDGAEAVRLAQDLGPDLTVLDVAMPRMTGIQAPQQLNKVAPDVRILMLSMHDNEQYFFEALRAGRPATSSSRRSTAT